MNDEINIKLRDNMKMKWCLFQEETSKKNEKLKELLEELDYLKKDLTFQKKKVWREVCKENNIPVSGDYEIENVDGEFYIKNSHLKKELFANMPPFLQKALKDLLGETET